MGFKQSQIDQCERCIDRIPSVNHLLASETKPWTTLVISIRSESVQSGTSPEYLNRWQIIRHV